MVGPRFVLRLSVMVNARETAGLLNPGFHRGKRKLGKDWRVQGRDGWGEAVQDRGEEGARGRHHLTFGPLPQTNGFGAGSEEDSADQDEEFDDEDENNEMEEEEAEEGEEGEEGEEEEYEEGEDEGEYEEGEEEEEEEYEEEEEEHAGPADSHVDNKFGVGVEDAVHMRAHNLSRAHSILLC